jgi:hypothetical protein
MWDFGDDLEVEAVIRRRHPNAVTVTYPDSTVKRSFWYAPNQTRRLFVPIDPAHNVEALISNYSAEDLDKDFGLRAHHISHAEFTFSALQRIKGFSRLETLKYLNTLKCTVANLLDMDFCIDTKEEEDFLKTEMKLSKDEIQYIKDFGE